jgi:multidrug efflux pump
METKKPINEEQFKEFGPASFSVKNVTTVYVLTAIIFLSGLMAYISMPSETFPEIVIPQIYVGTPYPGNSPSDIEKLITRPLEKEINGLQVLTKSHPHPLRDTAQFWSSSILRLLPKMHFEK